jgi:hypothetical protein
VLTVSSHAFCALKRRLSPDEVRNPEFKSKSSRLLHLFQADASNRPTTPLQPEFLTTTPPAASPNDPAKMPAPATILFNVGGAIGVIPGIFGLLMLFNPAGALEHAQWALPKDPYAQRLAKTLLRQSGSRNAVLGAVLGLLWRNGDPVLLAQGLVLGSAMPLWDGVLSRQLIGGGEWKHWAYVPLVLGTACGIFWYN